MSEPSEAQSPVRPAATSEPKRALLGRYELIGVIGTGGMATVYVARVAGEAGFQRLFAVKALHPHLAEEEGFVEMFLDEARLAARLHHPNAVPILDLGSHEGLHYVAMEYIEGCAFSSLLSRSREARPPRLVLPILLDALSGLHAAHVLVDDDGQPMHLVHRDVTPQNILVGVEGTARLADFGVARAESRSSSTRPGQLKGKLAFMAPEQLRFSKLDHRADIFSLGCVAWSALTGRRMFAGEDEGEIARAILAGDIAPPSTVGFKPPAALDAVIMKALSRNPDDRFATAQEMEDALREVAAREGLLGTRREVAQWVETAVGENLKKLRAAIRASSGRSTFDSVPTLPSVSSGGTTTDSGSIVVHLSGARVTYAAPDDVTVSASKVANAPETAGAKRRRGAVGITAAALLVVGGLFGVATLRRPPVPAPEPLSSTARSAAPVARADESPPVAVLGPALSEETAAKDHAGAGASASPAPVSPPPHPGLAAPYVAPYVPRATPTRAAGARTSTSDPAPAPAPTTPAPAPGKPTSWDEDSPLPPP